MVLLSAGSASRFRKDALVKKQWLFIDDTPLWLFVVNRFREFGFKNIVVVCSKQEISYMKNFDENITFVEGGEERQLSIKNALNFIDSEYVLVSDVARACVDFEMVDELMRAKNRADVIVPSLEVSDTVVYDGKTIDRKKVKLIQTPQLSKTKILKDAVSGKKLYTDDSSAIKANGGSVFFTKGNILAKKITTFADLEEIKCLKPPKDASFVGNGFDVHPFCEDKDMYLCGVEIDYPLGFEAHSDGDVAIHALIDSLLGAIGAGDIGELFPDSEAEFKDIDSKVLLKRVVDFINMVGFKIENIDITIMAQKPKLVSYKQKMRKTLADILGLEVVRVNVKATTTEKLGFVGRSEGVAVFATSKIKIYNWK